MAVGESAAEPVTVVAKEKRWDLQRGESVVFGRTGREGVHGLDPTDTGLSRAGCRVALSPSGVVVENLSTRRPLLVEYPLVVRQHRIEPESTHVLVGDATILIPGKNFTHAVLVTLPPHLIHDTGPIEAIDSVSAPTESEGLLTESDRLLLVALAAGYLGRWPRHDPNPRSYEAAAESLSIPVGTAKKRLENIRLRLADHDVLHTSGTHAMRTVIEWAIDTGVVRVSDLNSLP